MPDSQTGRGSPPPATNKKTMRKSIRVGMPTGGPFGGAFGGVVVRVYTDGTASCSCQPWAISAAIAADVGRPVQDCDHISRVRNNSPTLFIPAAEIERIAGREVEPDAPATLKEEGPADPVIASVTVYDAGVLHVVSVTRGLTVRCTCGRVYLDDTANLTPCPHMKDALNVTQFGRPLYQRLSARRDALAGQADKTLQLKLQQKAQQQKAGSARDFGRDFTEPSVPKTREEVDEEAEKRERAREFEILQQQKDERARRTAHRIVKDRITLNLPGVSVRSEDVDVVIKRCGGYVELVKLTQRSINDRVDQFPIGSLAALVAAGDDLNDIVITTVRQAASARLAIPADAPVKNSVVAALIQEFGGIDAVSMETRQAIFAMVAKAPERLFRDPHPYDGIGLTQQEFPRRRLRARDPLADIVDGLA